ncbi:Wadjet anti-phage system protein JetD domain-containing protein [Arthrobacter sp. NPDC058097]|uniref:Wadjet anti-phage system protein JetD domain-containing protein n=1 Tax=Arthrobacter sp. NPDC058097 TaxID=3346340 RepID=UPI0036D7AFB2
MPVESWTTVAGLRALSLKAWNSGALLRELLEPSGAYPRRRVLKRPMAEGLRSDYAAAQRWAAELFAGVGPYELETAEVGRRTVGSNRIPAAAVFATVEDEVGFIGKSREAARFRDLTASLGELDPLLAGWAARRPLKLLELGSDAVTAARVALWLRDNPAPGIYVRQLGLPGVHTKFIERHRQVIDQLLAALRCGSHGRELDVDAEASVEVPEPDAAESDAALESGAGRTPAARFARRHGFHHPPELVRFRILDPSIPALGGARDITITAEAFSTLRLPVHTVIATENQVNFLALPERAGTLALYGAGYGFSSIRDAAWLRECVVLYWGDIDTHGFGILDQLRRVHPHVASVLMDEETLLAHRDFWTSEPSPSPAGLTRLSAEESTLYEALGNDTYGPAVRLEQELIRWDWALNRLHPGAG